MILNKYFLTGLHLLVTYHVVKTFVILSANVDDVKKIAKEFSGPLTDEIVGLILKATKNYTFNSSNENEAHNFKSNLNLPLKLKYKNIIRNKNEPIHVANYNTEDINEKETQKYSYYIAPKIHNYAEVKTETQRTHRIPKIHNVVSLSNHISPPQIMKKISVETFEPQKFNNDDLKQVPKISSQILNEPKKNQNDHQNQIIAAPSNNASQDAKISSKISDELKLYNNVDPENAVTSQLPDSSKKLKQHKKTTKKKDTSTKIIELNSDSNGDTDFHQIKPSSKKSRKKSKTVQVQEAETTAKTSLEAEVSIITKTKRYKAVPVTTPTTRHNDDTTVDLELQKFEKEVRGYFTSKSSSSAMSEATSEKMIENIHSSHRNVKHKHSKRHKKHNQKHNHTEATTVNLVQLVEKVERLDQVAQKIMSSTMTMMPSTTTKNVSPTRPTPAYPKQEEYKIPDSEFKLSYDPNQKKDFRDYRHMYAQYFKRNQMVKEPEGNVQKINTIGKLSEIIQKIIETRLESKLSDTTVTRYSSRRQHMSSRSTEVRNMRGLLTNSEEDAMFKIIKAMIDSKKVHELKSTSYLKERKRSTINAFNIQKMSPEENMADVIHKMVDSSLRMQFEKPEMSVSALAETLKNKYYENHIASGNKKVSEMIEKLIEKKIQEYAQTTTKIAHSKKYHDKMIPKNHKTRPSERPRYKNIARAFTPNHTSLPSRYQTRTRTTKLEEVGRIEFQIPFAEFPRTSTTNTNQAGQTFKEEPSSKWYQNQYTTPIPSQGSAIKISHGRQGPISIVIEDKESDEIKRPMPQAFLLQKQQTTHRIDPHIIVVDNRHVDPPSTKASYWVKELKTELIKKILRDRETTKKIDTTTTTRHKHIRHSDYKQNNDGTSESNRVPNVQLVFLNVPQLDTKEREKQILREKQETEKIKEEEKRREKEKKMEEERRREEERKREQEKKKEEMKREEDRKREEKRLEEQRREEEKKKEDERRREEKKKVQKSIQEEKIREAQKRQEEEKKQEQERRKKEEEIREDEERIAQEKRLEEEKMKEEKSIQEEKRIAEKSKLEEDRKREDERRKEEEIRKEVEKKENEKLALRQKMEKEMKVKEILDRKWEKDLENQIKEKQNADRIAALQEAQKKRKEAEEKMLDYKLHLMQEKIKKDLELALKHKNETQITQSIQSTATATLNYWERQWQQDQEMKLREDYNKYMKLHNAGPGLSEKTINYWNEQWRVDLERKLREKQNEEYEKTIKIPNNNWYNTEPPISYYNVEKLNTDRVPALRELVSSRPDYAPITDAFGNIMENKESLQSEPSKQYHYNWEPSDKHKHKGSGRSILENIIIMSSVKPRPNRFGARRDDDYSDTIYFMPDGRKRDKIVIKRVHEKSNRVTAIEDMSEEHTHKNSKKNKKHHRNKNYDDVVKSDTNEQTDNNHNNKKYEDDVIKSDTIIKANKIDWRKPQRTKNKKVTALRVKTEEQTETNFDVDKTSETIASENEIKSENDKTESEPIKESNENILRTKKDGKPIIKHIKVKKDKSKREGEEKKENTIRTQKRKTKNDNKKDTHEKRKKNKPKNEIEYDKKVERKNKNKTKEDNDNTGKLSDENEKFESNYQEKVKRKPKHRKKVKAEKEDEEKTGHKKPKTKYRKGKKEKLKTDADNEEELYTKHEKDEEQKKKKMLKTKHRKEKKGNSKDDEDEPDQKHKEQFKEERKTKHKKKEIEKSDKTKDKKRKHRKEENDHEDESKEKYATQEKGDKKAKNKKSDEVESHQKREQDRKRKSNKNDDDDGGREFDFQLMFGEKGRND